MRLPKPAMFQPLAALVVLMLGTGPAAAAIARPELVTPFPEPGVWTDPQRPGTYLTFDRVAGVGWQARLLEFDDDGWPEWTELHGDGELDYMDPAFARVPGNYALARGEFNRSTGGRVPFTASTRSEQLALIERTGAPDLAFLDRNTAIWDFRNNGGRLLRHETAGSQRFRPDPQLLYWMVVRDHLKVQTGVVRFAEIDDSEIYTLDCLDCWREYGAINTDAVAAGTFIDCRVAFNADCQGFQFSLREQPIAQLSLPYLDRFHSLALDQDADRAVEEFWLVPVMPSAFTWKINQNPQARAPSTARLPNGVFQGADQTLAFAPPLALLTGHDEIGMPRWWSAVTPLAQAVFLETRSTGRLATPVTFREAVPAAFTHNVYTSFDANQVLRVRNTAVPGPSTTERTLAMSQLPSLDPGTPNDIVLLSLRSGESELLGKVQLVREQVLVPNASFERTTLRCLDCVQRGASGQRGRGAGELEKQLARISWTRPLSVANAQISYTLGSRTHLYALARDNRFDFQTVLRLQDFGDGSTIATEVPIEIRMLPVPGLKEGN